MAELGPTLTTERLVLRPPRAQDLEPWTAMMADAEAARFIGGPQPASIAWRTMAAMTGAWTLRGYSMFSVLERAAGRWIGRVGPWRPEGWPGPEVGWGLIREAWGQGYAQEAAAASIDWAFDQLGWSEVIHCIDPANVASVALARRLGSGHQGPCVLPAPHEHSKAETWGQTAGQWRARRR